MNRPNVFIPVQAGGFLLHLIWPAPTGKAVSHRPDLVPETPVIKAYMDRVNARPAVAKVRAAEAELVARFTG